MFGHKYDGDSSNHSYDSDTNWRTSETWPNNLHTFSQSKISSKKRQTFLGTGTRSCKPVRMISSLLNMSTEETNSGADTAKNSFLPLVQDLSPEKIKDSQESILTWLRQPQVTPSLVPNTGARVVDVAQDGGLTDTPNIGARVVDVAQDGGLTLVPNIGARAVDVAQDGGLTDTPNTGVRVVDVAQDGGLTDTPNTGVRVVDVAQDGGLTLVPNTGARVVDVAQDGGLTDTPNTGVRVVDVAQDGGLTLVPNIGARVVDVAQDGGLTLIPNSGARVVDVAQDGGLTLIPNSGARVVDVAQDGGLTLVPNSGARVVNVAQDGGLTLVTNSGARVVDVAQDGGLTLVPNSGARVVDVAQDGGLTLIPNTGVRVVDVAQDGGLTDTPNTGVRAAPLYDVAPCLLSRQASDISDDCCQPKKSLHNSYVTPMKSSHNVSTTQSLPRGGKTALHDLTNNLPFSKSMPAMVSGQNSQDRRPTTCHQQSDNKENEMNTTATRMSESTPLKNGQYVSEGNSMSAQLKVYSKSSHLRLPLGTHMPRSGALMEQVVNKDLRVPFRVAEPGPTRGVVNTMSVIQEVYCVKQQTITSSPILADTFRPCTKDVGVQCSAQTADAVTMTDTPHGKDKDVLCVNGRRYTTLNKLGLGGSCVVYQVRDHESSSVLAVKCVSLPVHDKMLAQGYLNEVSMIRRLQGSECVIKLIDSEHIPEKNLLYVVMELGETDFSQLIRDTFRTRGKLSLTMILFYWTEMLTAVKYIHDNEVIHSDLKPSNFLVVKGRLKLIDFGISSSVQCDATSVLKDQAMGTINYMSPEAIVDTQDFSNRAQYRISYRSDVWSLGCILYYMIYGRTPFQHIRQPYAKVAAITDPNSQVQYPPAPRLLTNVVQSCLAFDPKKRPTVADLLSVPFFTWEDFAPSGAPTKDRPRD